MAIKTSTFSGWQLTGEDAKAFERQIENCNSNSYAVGAVLRGEKLAGEYLQKGYVSLTSKSAILKTK